MAARLRLPADMPDAEKEERAEGLIKRLGLANARARAPCGGRLPGPVCSESARGPRAGWALGEVL
jgi:hypothetical protein